MYTKPKTGTLSHEVKLPWKQNGFFPAGTPIEILEVEPAQIEEMPPMVQVRLPGLPQEIVGVPVDWVIPPFET